MSAIEDVSRTLEELAAPYALIGGHAVAARGHPRMTLDYDFLTTDSVVLQARTWVALEEHGAKVDLRKGDFDDPVAGVARITFSNGEKADVVLAKWNWERGVIERAERLDIEGVAVPVPRTADLILLKLAAGGVLDLQDVVNLLHAGEHDALVREVNERIDALPDDAGEAWQRIVTSMK